MKVEWKYEGKQYIIYDDREGNLYLNCCLCDCADILKDIQNPNGKIVRQTKRKAKELWLSILQEKENERFRKAKIIEEYKKSQIQDKKIKEMIEKVSYIIVFTLFVGCILYFVFQVWWFFIGDSAFNGPFANYTSAGETIGDTIIFFIALIVIIEEVIRRIRNGHF